MRQCIARLSVSPIGSSPLQPNRHPLSIQCQRLVFQYPQSDRALCNQVGTKVYVRQVPTFSIPNRIEPSATTAQSSPQRTGGALSVSPIGSSPLQPHRGCGCACRRDTFSIPNRIEPSATVITGAGCGFDCLAFSIPNRIEPSATDGIPWAKTREAAFSIPNRIEPSATGRKQK